MELERLMRGTGVTSSNNHIEQEVRSQKKDEPSNALHKKGNKLHKEGDTAGVTTS